MKIIKEHRYNKAKIRLIKKGFYYYLQKIYYNIGDEISPLLLISKAIAKRMNTDDPVEFLYNYFAYGVEGDLYDANFVFI